MPASRSLSLRLMAYAAGAIGVALVLAWLALGLLFERHTERQVEAELRRHGAALAAALSLDAGQRPVLAAEPFDPRFSRPASGLYWRITAPGGELGSRSLWDGDLPPASADASWRADTVAGPFEARVIRLSRAVQPDAGGPKATIEVAVDHATVTAARKAFAGDLALSLGVLWLVLMAAAGLQVRLGLRPLAGVRRELAALRTDPDARFDIARHPAEIVPLAAEINALADARAGDLIKARDRARDLAHALKTPLTALRAQAAALPAEAAREIGQSLSLLTTAVESELARARVSATHVGPRSTSARRAVERLAQVLTRTERGTELDFEIDISETLILPMAEDAALEALGALLDNAVRHARSRVRVWADAGAEGPWLAIADDGPGIPEAWREKALRRGARLDESSPTHGLGLAIARDFIEASGGTLTLAGEVGEGLEVIARWPGER